jgi:ATP-dependent RNA helicase HelY
VSVSRPRSEPTPAERHAAARDRSRLGDFPEHYPFGLDPFQKEGCLALARGHSVLVAAPTGAGKTVVGEFAVHQALRSGRKCFYTTPIKALSNQKFHDLVARYGADRVGLLTGDNSINGEAPVVVMTTEVLRNMLYAESTTLDQLGYVVMDEVHYLADRFRGAVWEEVIIHLPEGVLLAALSATVSNAEEFGEWLGTVRGTTDIIVDEHRPVPLWQQVMVGDRLLDLFVDEQHHRVNPELLRIARDAARWPEQRRRGRRPSRDRLTPWRTDVVTELHDDHLLPGITFIFSRAGCDAAVEQCLSAGLMLTSPDERREIEEFVDSRTIDIPHEDLGVLGYASWREALRRGIAAHHAGMLPVFKEVVEGLFQRGLVKMVFATETLALGINMPARTVVLERLVKWNGENHVDITPGEYTQLTGRAGRRGIDVEGHAVVVWHPGLDPQALAGLASTRTYPLRSSFRPSYNMAVSLIKRMGRSQARDVLETSFAQFQADRGVVALAAQVRRNDEALAGYRDAMQCHLGDFEEYAALRRQLSDTERGAAKQRGQRDRAALEDSLRSLRTGDVVALPAGRRVSPAAVVVVDDSGLGAPPRITLVTLDRQVRRIGVGELHAPLVVIGRMRIPKGFAPRSATDRKALAERLRGFVDEAATARPPRRTPADGPDETGELRRRLRQHACHGCAEREAHARWAERYHRLARETEALQRRVDSRTTSVARQFDRICDLLLETGYLEGDPADPRVTTRGDLLAGIYSDSDLLVAQAITEGMWDGLEPPDLAAMAGAVVYEGRQREDSPRLPGGRVRSSATALVDLAQELGEIESRFGVPQARELDLGFVWPVHSWAQGGRLAGILEQSDMAAGDFVRWCRQAIDLLDQIREATGPGHPLHATARRARDLIDRGIIAYSATA